MGILELVNLLASLAAATLRITTTLNEATVLFKRMSDEGRTTLTPGEEAQLVATRDAARAALVDEIGNP